MTKIKKCQNCLSFFLRGNTLISKEIPLCGIVGYYSSSQPLNTLNDSCQAIAHRGPDAQGEIGLRNNTLLLGHRRLSILDLSQAGAQPMQSHNGRYWIVYNGEIYNQQSLKEELNRNWRGHSDTEILLEAISEWGLEVTLTKIKGMYAIALYDSKDDKLFLIRDRMGEKPLYYAKLGESFAFSSELKALIAIPGFKRNINLEAVSGYFSYSYVPQDLSIYENVFKLLPGHILEYHFKNSQIDIKKYWDIKSFYKKDLGLSYSEASQKLEEMIELSVRQQMISDVPLGAFLSGGVDSSAIVALMQKNSTRKIRTFSIGFSEKAYNEAEYAKAVANHLGTEHTELYVTPQDALNVIPKLPEIYDEPFADSSQIPTYLLSKMTSGFVKVSLSGDAGDELFGGYNRYLLANKIKNFNQYAPKLMSSAAIGMIDLVPSGAWNRLRGIGIDKIFKLKRVLGVRSEQEIYDILVRHWGKDLFPVKNVKPYAMASLFPEGTFQERMMLQDSLNYLPDDILVKVDRAAMAVSLETRVPFLDKDIVEFALSLPLDYKIGSSSKMILRDILYKYVPKDLIERPKMGFGVPIDSWLRGELREWAEDLLSPTKLKRHDLLDVKLIRNMWQDHLSAKSNWQYYLWDVLMFQSWYGKYMGQK